MAATRVSSSDAPLASVIVVNFNGRHHLQRCIPAVLERTSVPIELIVVDNGSQDGSVAWLRESFQQVSVVALSRNLGFGEANRRGVERARGRFVALLNNDTVVDPGWLAPLVETLEREPDVAAVCSTLVLMAQPELLNARGGGMTWLGYGFDRDFLLPAEPATVLQSVADTEEVLFPTAAAMLLRRDEFLSVGGFDPAFFMYHEDVDFGWRLWLLGRRVLVHSRSIVRHAFGGTTAQAKGMAWRERLGMRHNLRSLLKHYELRPLLRAAVGIARIWRRNRAYGQMGHALSWNLLHLPSTLRARRWVQTRKRVHNLDLIARGLIDQAGFPAPPPEPPVAEPRRDLGTWVASGTLCPGEDSASSRLGFGWYSPEMVGGAAMRWTSGDARCFLRVADGSTGTLRLEVRKHRAAAPTLVATCNGTQQRTELTGDEWNVVELPVEADSEGLLDVRLASPRTIPHDVVRNWDFRRLGCGVREIRFVPAAASAAPADPSVSVVIPTHNRLTTLKLTLEALDRQTDAPLEVIVIDDGSTDDTWKWLDDWQNSGPATPTRLAIRQPNLKQGQARNQGVRHASGDLVLFLGDDTVPDESCVHEHVIVHRRFGPSTAVVGFTDWHREKMTVTPFLEFINTDGPQFGYRWMQDGTEVPFTCLYTSNVSIDAAALGDRPFDPSFTVYGWEDSELGYRLVRAGVRIVYSRRAGTRHVHPMSLGGFLRRQQLVGRAVQSLFGLHPELEGHRAMPPNSPPRTVRVLSPFLRAFEPIAAFIDRSGVRLPDSIYRGLVLNRYFAGRRQGLTTTASGT